MIHEAVCYGSLFYKHRNINHFYCFKINTFSRYCFDEGDFHAVFVWHTLRTITAKRQNHYPLMQQLNFKQKTLTNKQYWLLKDKYLVWIWPTSDNWRIDHLLVGQSKLTFSQTNNGQLRYVITHNLIWAYHRTASFVYRWLRAHAMFDVKCFPTFVKAPDVSSSFLSIRWLDIHIPVL